jgi:hypothetical protein
MEQPRLSPIECGILFILLGEGRPLSVHSQSSSSIILRRAKSAVAPRRPVSVEPLEKTAFLRSPEMAGR